MDNKQEKHNITEDIISASESTSNKQDWTMPIEGLIDKLDMYNATPLSHFIGLRFKKLTPDAIPFKYIHNGDACMDIFSQEEAWLDSGETKIIYSGIAVEIPRAFEGLVRGRSGLASKGIFAHLGTIDSNYRGNVGVILTNLSREHFFIEKGMRIGQFTIKPVIYLQLEEREKLSQTERGENGYGSSGLK